MKSLGYRAAVAATGTSAEEKYVGLTANTFKQRFVGHKQDFNKQDNRSKSTLTGHIWNLNDKHEEPKVNWEVVCRAALFSPTTGVCIVQPMNQRKVAHYV